MASRGFTLIELLVVLVIIGVVTSMAVIAVRGDSLDQVADEELQRLAALLTLASEQAVMEGREYGVLFERDGYGFTRYQDGKWMPIEDDQLLRSRKLSRGLTLSLDVEGRPAVAKQVSKEGAAPQLFLYSSGERTPFELKIAAPDLPPLLRMRGRPFDTYQIEALGSR